MAFRKNFKNNEEVNSDEEKKRIIRQHAQSSVKLLKYDEVKDVNTPIFNKIGTNEE